MHHATLAGHVIAVEGGAATPKHSESWRVLLVDPLVLPPNGPSFSQIMTQRHSNELYVVLPRLQRLVGLYRDQGAPLGGLCLAPSLSLHAPSLSLFLFTPFLQRRLGHFLMTASILRAALPVFGPAVPMVACAGRGITVTIVSDTM